MRIIETDRLPGTVYVFSLRDDDPDHLQIPDWLKPRVKVIFRDKCGPWLDGVTEFVTYAEDHAVHGHFCGMLPLREFPREDRDIVEWLIEGRAEAIADHIDFLSRKRYLVTYFSGAHTGHPGQTSELRGFISGYGRARHSAGREGALTARAALLQRSAPLPGCGPQPLGDDEDHRYLLGFHYHLRCVWKDASSNAPLRF